MASDAMQAHQVWDTDRYQNQHDFVWQYGTALLDLLKVKPGDRILDLGCGTGELTHALAETGAIVSGIDADADMIAVAQQQYPQLSFGVADARTFTLEQAVDGIFSNAVLHWVKPPEQVVQRVANGLKPGGQFVAEFGGRGNVQKIVEAVETVRQRKNLNSWYFPSVGDYAHLLETYGLEVSFAALIDRPTLLKDGDCGLANWLRMFGGQLFVGLSSDDVDIVISGVESLLRSHLYDGSQWHADYRRLRVVAVKR
ncbi:MAG: methyltransferase domain-containing protein [Leptolyngbyaceae cyanobacterium MAG.088]|nr:methyltransferase domain-containing protein [Leptolyngbyaceae cyanobacterium MAG.088]